MITVILLQNKNDTVQYMDASNCIYILFPILSIKIYIIKIYVVCFNFRGKETWCRLHDSSLLNLLGQCLCLYGDPAYPMSLRVHLQTPLRDARLTAAMDSYNKSTSHVWVSFGEIIRSFKFLDFRSNLKLGLSSVGKMYMVCSIMQNALSCMDGNQTSEYFGWDPPSIQEYFSFVIVNFVVQTLLINSTLKLIYLHDNV